MKIRASVMRVQRDGTIVSDYSRGAWSLELFDCWLACFGEDFRQRYGATWAVGYGRDKMWWYYPPPKNPWAPGAGGE